MNSNFINRFLIATIIGPIILLLIFLGNNYFLFLILFLFFVGIYEIIILKNTLSKIIIFFIFLYFLYSCLKIENLTNGKTYLYFILFVTWLSDLGGYVVGKSVGGRKIGIISPNKTFSGMFGSILFSYISIFFIEYYKIFSFESLISQLIIITFSSLIVIIGDLFFSYLKRINNIKDYSKILGGHGGLFDRIDGLIFLTIFFNIFIDII